MLGETSFSLFSAQLRDIGFNIEDDFLLKARTILTALAGIEGILEYKPKKTSVCPLYLLECISKLVTDRTMRTRRRYTYPDCFFYGTDTKLQVKRDKAETSLNTYCCCCKTSRSVASTIRIMPESKFIVLADTGKLHEGMYCSWTGLVSAF